VGGADNFCGKVCCSSSSSTLVLYYDSFGENQFDNAFDLRIFSGQGLDEYMQNVVYREVLKIVVCSCNFVICTVKYTHTPVH
jgi:hypothetical protein